MILETYVGVEDIDSVRCLERAELFHQSESDTDSSEEEEKAYQSAAPREGRRHILGNKGGISKVEVGDDSDGRAGDFEGRCATVSDLSVQSGANRVRAAAKEADGRQFARTDLEHDLGAGEDVDGPMKGR